MELPFYRRIDNEPREVYEVDAPPPSTCTHPECKGSDVRFHSQNDFSFKDIPQNNRKAEIVIRRRRYFCRDCKRTFQEPLPEIPENQRVTERLRWYVGVQVLINNKDFKSLAEKIDADPKTIQTIFKDYLKYLESATPFSEYIRIKGIEFRKATMPVIYNINVENINQKRILNILESKDSLGRYLENLSPNIKEKIKFVLIDKTPEYRQAVETTLPHVKIVLDKSTSLNLIKDIRPSRKWEYVRDISYENAYKEYKQYISTFNKRRDALTERDSKIIERWSSKCEPLYDLYDFKESFYEIWSAPSRSEALKRFYQLENKIKAITGKHASILKEVIGKINSWRNETFNYFDLPIKVPKPSYWEKYITTIYSLGHGYSFEILKARVIYGRKDLYSKVDEYGFEVGSKFSFVFSLLMEGRYTRKEILDRLDQKYRGANNAHDFTVFISDLKKLPGKYPHSRGVKIGKAENGILFLHHSDFKKSIDRKTVGSTVGFAK